MITATQFNTMGSRASSYVYLHPIPDVPDPEEEQQDEEDESDEEDQVYDEDDDNESGGGRRRETPMVL
ncbi:unnamed protein product [Zymoseptoria tritici ST99CH_3D7]|uniref:Uncharacterized protein n=1 Tax=Zymoseptoria tritici (strain ST99CH_3D7) TaxID=1276538 RepID=A0A1X7S5N2_ZYMT9|nr:unnamed protein product [Zymoseptoria tritici ST99CH_3D7]